MNFICPICNNIAFLSTAFENCTFCTSCPYKPIIFYDYINTYPLSNIIKFNFIYQCFSYENFSYVFLDFKNKSIKVNTSSDIFYIPWFNPSVSDINNTISIINSFILLS